jgi:hypothetical protein
MSAFGWVGWVVAGRTHPDGWVEWKGHFGRVDHRPIRKPKYFTEAKKAT